MGSALNAGKRLRQLLASREICIAPGVHDLLTARVMERAGFQVAIAGFAPLAKWLNRQGGMPSMPELLMAQVEVICANTRLAVILDDAIICETPSALPDVLPRFEEWGVSGVIVRSPVMATSESGIMERQERLIRRLAAARTDSDLVIIASAKLGRHSALAEVVQCAKSYRSAGADMILVQGLRSADQLAAVPQEIVDVPLMVKMGNQTEMPLLSASELQNLGYSMVYWPCPALVATARATWETGRELKTLGKVTTLPDRGEHAWWS